MSSSSVAFECAVREDAHLMVVRKQKEHERRDQHPTVIFKGSLAVMQLPTTRIHEVVGILLSSKLEHEVLIFFHHLICFSDGGLLRVIERLAPSTKPSTHLMHVHLLDIQKVNFTISTSFTIRLSLAFSS